MYIALAIFASVIGLFVTGAAIFTAWAYYSSRHRPADSGKEGQPSAAGSTLDWFMRWTVADYAVLFLFGFGFVFLVTDLVGVAKDRELYPMYHYAYLLSGIIFASMGMLFTFVRLALVLRLTGKSAPVGHHAGEPNQTEQSE